MVENDKGIGNGNPIVFFPSKLVESLKEIDGMIKTIDGMDHVYSEATETFHPILLTKKT